MTQNVNQFGQPVGESVVGWKAPTAPPREAWEGKHCRLEPLKPELHAADLFRALAADSQGLGWTYLPYGPFREFEEFRQWMLETCTGADPLFFSLFDTSHLRPLGVASYLRITPASGSIEVGHIHYSARLQRSRAATEAMYLMMERAFDLGYRRYEWKCDSLNAPSRAAAQRLGFSFEGIFRQATVYKGRNRDTAWYSIIDAEWPELQRAFQTWLDPSNFDESGRQKSSLSSLTRTLLKSIG